MSELLLRGLDRPGERTCLAVCACMVAIYLGVFAWLLHASTRFDQIFLAKQEDVVLQQLMQHRMILGQPVNIASARFPVAELELLDGWSVVEAGGVWSAAPTVRFAVALPAKHPASLALDLRGVIMAPANGKQGIQLYANDARLGSWQFVAGNSALCAVLPPTVADSATPLRIRLEFSHPTRPAGGLDSRELGLSLQQVTVVPGPCPPATSAG